MRTEKKSISAEYLSRLNASPFVYLVEYRGLNNIQFSELRKRLRNAGAEVHVVKNSIFGIAAKEAGLGDLSEQLKGQVAAVTGGRDLATAAKTLKSFSSEFDKAKVRGGFLGNKKLSSQEVIALADLPSIEVLRGKLLGLIQTPASQIARIIGTPAGQLARVLQARVDKETQS